MKVRTIVAMTSLLIPLTISISPASAMTFADPKTYVGGYPVYYNTNQCYTLATNTMGCPASQTRETSSGCKKNYQTRNGTYWLNFRYWTQGFNSSTGWFTTVVDTRKCK